MFVNLDEKCATWELVGKTVAADKAKNVFQLGTKKNLYNRYGTLIAQMHLIGFNEDENMAGARLRTTWMAKYSTISGVMNSSTVDSPRGSTIGGWETSEARAFLNGYLFSQLPEYLQKMIKPAVKLSDHGYTGVGLLNNMLCRTVDKIWLPSIAELGYSKWSDDQGVVSGQGKHYSGLATIDDCIVNHIPGGSGKIAWLRSSYKGSETNFFSIGTSGVPFNESHASEGYIYPFCFCI